MLPEHLIFFLAAIFTFGGFALLRKLNRLKRTGRQAVATVIDNQRSTDSEGTDGYTPKAVFHTDKHEQITIWLSTGRRPARLGKKVDILYDPNKPGEAEENSFFRMVIVPWLIIVTGLAGLMLAGSEILGMTDIVTNEWETGD